MHVGEGGPFHWTPRLRVGERSRRSIASRTLMTSYSRRSTVLSSLERTREHSFIVASSMAMAGSSASRARWRRRRMNCWQRKARPVTGTAGSSGSSSVSPVMSGRTARSRRRNSYTAACTRLVPCQMNCDLHERSTTRRH